MCTVYAHVISHCTVRILLRQCRIVGKLPGQGQPCADDLAEELDEGRMAGSAGMIFPFFVAFGTKAQNGKMVRVEAGLWCIYICVYGFELPHERHIFSILAWTTPEGNDFHSLVNHESKNSRDYLIGRQTRVMDSIPRKGCILPSTRQRVRNPSLLFHRKHGWDACHMLRWKTILF